MRMFNVTIEFIDGSTQLIRHVDREVVADGVLNLYRDRPYSGGYEHLGSWPIQNIKRWQRTE
jgi:hypothetical protein